MNYKKGKPLTPEVKKLVVSVKKYFDRSKLDSTLQDEPSTKQTANSKELLCQLNLHLLI